MRSLPLLCALLAACPPVEEEPPPDPATATVVSFNTGTTEGMGHDQGPDDGYNEQHALLSDTWYGDGLAWVPAVEAATEFFDTLRPDVVAFQEIFFSDLCADIPADAHGDFVCESWTAGDLTVAQTILGDGWQVACHPGKDDKCAAVHEDFGRFAGCDDAFCLEGLEGFSVDGCGNGARVARGTIELVDGGEITLINVHGSSGLAGDDIACRVQQFDQVFLDFGDGAPGAIGTRNLILGDLNSDPGRWSTDDAVRWRDFVARPDEEPDGRSFLFLTDAAEDAPPTYGGIANIDHVVTDFAGGACWHAGITPGHEAVTDAKYFDHVPAVCALEF
jgi:hypothetical protein